MHFFSPGVPLLGLFFWPLTPVARFLLLSALSLRGHQVATCLVIPTCLKGSPLKASSGKELLSCWVNATGIAALRFVSLLSTFIPTMCLQKCHQEALHDHADLAWTSPARLFHQPLMLVLSPSATTSSSVAPRHRPQP